MPAAQKPDGYIPRIVDAQMERYLRVRRNPPSGAYPADSWLEASA